MRNKRFEHHPKNTFDSCLIHLSELTNIESTVNSKHVLDLAGARKPLVCSFAFRPSPDYISNIWFCRIFIFFLVCVTPSRARVPLLFSLRSDPAEASFFSSNCSDFRFLAKQTAVLSTLARALAHVWSGRCEYSFWLTARARALSIENNDAK